MRWQGRRGSANVQDRRGRGGLVAGGGIGAVILAIVITLMGGEPGTVLDQAAPPADAPTAQQDSLGRFVSVVLADTEEVWEQIFRDSFGQGYPEPTLVLFSGMVNSACGFAQAAMGPFYCPLDQQVYIDLAFYEELRGRLGAPGDFAQAYVIAHEVGHHVQTVTGISESVRAEQQRLSQAGANELSVRQELQADCFAGVWANRAQQMFGILEPGDIEEALGAASAVGDDRLQAATGGEIVPESFTHGTSEQRMRWFDRGFRSGDPGSCDAFGDVAAALLPASPSLVVGR